MWPVMSLEPEKGVTPVWSKPGIWIFGAPKSERPVMPVSRQAAEGAVLCTLSEKRSG